ncbi:lysozyme [Paracoccus alkanivorans]|uniref:lysozyme n=1 Tax=Paracoccus alkanivorans TaxID=2116655 RepID=UPI001FB6A4CE|nr:lysozyme [Paracoccus alkanivorans]
MENIILQFLSTLLAWLKSLVSTKRKAATTTGTAAILAAAAAFVGPWEGERTEAYLDSVASPPVWTVCYGETRGVKAGNRYSSAECSAMLMEALDEFRDRLITCIPSLPQQPEGVQVALVSWSYNVGTGAACSSMLAKRANSGRWRDACNELPR